ncbi:MAG: PorT family protein [Sphingobacteriales bacterium JAD_PAG50586_3]|nr:MAG: PorT family protein [Sphingobacteriales bacterium JAD_PAG50586_3]
MKKLLLLLAIGATISASAQVKNEVGIVAGGNVHYSLENVNYTQYYGRLGYNVGFTNNLQFGKHSVFVAAMLETQNIKSTPATLFEPWLSPSHVVNNNRQISVPLLYRYTFGDKKLQPFVNGGPQFGFGFKRATTFYYDHDFFPQEPITYEKKDLQFNLSAALGGGVKYNVNDRVSLSAEYRQSFLMYSKTRDKNMDNKTTVAIGDDDFVPYTSSYLLVGAAVKIGKK